MIDWLLYASYFTEPISIIIALLSLILMISFYIWGNEGHSLGQKSGTESRKEGSLGDYLKDIHLQGPWKHSAKRHSDGLERTLELENPC